MAVKITASNLSYTYPDGRVALKDINLSISDGEKVALIGPNGAGKSTLLLHFNGLLSGSGTVNIGGTPISDNNVRDIRKKVGLVLQDPNDQLFCPTAREDVLFGPMHFNFKTGELESIVTASLSRVGLSGIESRPSHHLSMGEKRRLSIACVLACEPEILAFDEPAAMLDPKRRRWLINFLNETKLTAVIATHDLAFANETCSRVILMNEGMIVADGNAQDILFNKTLLVNNDLEALV